jgi:hypothetical protein
VCGSRLRADQARGHLAACLGPYRQLGDRAGQAHVSHALGHVAGRQNRYSDAIGHEDQALALFQAIGDRAGQAYVPNTIGWHHIQAGHTRQAQAFCRQALDLRTPDIEMWIMQGRGGV